MDRNNYRISSTLFYSFLWTGTAISISFVVLRCGIRWKLFRRLYWDDAFVGFAVIAMIAQAIVWTVDGAGLFISYDVATGRLSPTPYRIEKMLQANKIQLGALILFFSGIWAIKIAFLLFFRRIGSRVQGYRIGWWWTTLGLVLATWVISLAVLPYRCMTGSLEYILEGGCTSPSSVNYYYAIFYVNCAFDIFTDLLLISIPVLFLWNVQIPLKQKLALIGLFSLTICVMIVAIIRVAVNGKQNGTTQDNAWIAFWAIIEITTAIVVACLGSFRQLFVKSTANRASSSDSSNQSTIHSIRQRFTKASTGWRRGHRKTQSRAALMNEETSYSPEFDVHGSEMKSAEVDVRRTEVPLKRASQAHIAHYSAAPTERKYMVVYPGQSIEHGTSAPKYGFF